MADAQPFRALRYDPAKVDLAKAIAPPYDVISVEQQIALYDRSPYNIVRVEYGEQRAGDGERENRYTRARTELASWRGENVLTREAAPAMYSYQLEFEWEGTRHVRRHYFVVVRLEEWEKGVVKPHEHTLAGPKADRLELLRATRTQVSPVYCLYRPHPDSSTPDAAGVELYDFDADGQRHTLSAISSPDAIASIQELFARSDFYIADGHHRYETALSYRNERRSAALDWTSEEPENFVLMAVTDASDPGLLVLPTHRLVHRPLLAGGLDRIAAIFDREDVGEIDAWQSMTQDQGVTSFVAFGLEEGRASLLRLRDRTAVASLMPADESTPWKRLDVNVLQYGILQNAFGIDDAALRAGGAVAYIQSPQEALTAVKAGRATAAFLLNATPVEQVLAVSDVNGRMPQKSTFFHPKLPTGLVLNALD